jgi:hypothetical protein
MNPNVLAVRTIAAVLKLRSEITWKLRIAPATQTKIVEGEVDFSLFQKDFIKKAVQLSEEQYLQNHSILSKLKLEYGPDIFAKVFEKESKEQKNDILLGAVDLTSKESLIFELADHHLKFELAYKLQFDHVDFFYPLIEEFSDAIIDETLSSLSLKALKELVKYPDLVPLQLEKFHTQAKECTFLRNKKLIAKLSENFSSSAVRKAIVAILTPKELEKAQLGLFAIEKKNSALMTYLDCFLVDFDLRTQLLSGDYLVGYKEDASSEFKTTFSTKWYFN